MTDTYIIITLTQFHQSHVDNPFYGGLYWHKVPLQNNYLDKQFQKTRPTDINMLIKY